MSKYTHEKHQPIRQTCSTKCHNIQINTDPARHEIRSLNRKKAYQTQLKNPEHAGYMRRLGAKLHLSPNFDYGASGRAGLERLRGTPEYDARFKKAQQESWTPKRKERISDALKAIWRNRDFREKHIAIMQKSLHTPEVRLKQSEAAKRSYANGRVDPDVKYIYLKRTNLERAIELPLYLSNIPYIRNLRVYRYYLDFAIPEIMLAIECDGLFWHSRCGEKDAKRDAYLASRGWTVIRLLEAEIKADPINALSEKVLPFIERALDN